MANQRLNIDIVANDKSKQAFNGIQSSLSRLKNSVFNLQNAFISLGAGLAIRSLINTGKEIESLKVRLKFLFGSAKEGSKAFDEMAKFASKVPFSLQEIQQGSGSLAVVAKDATQLKELLEITGNVAAVTGLDFATSSAQIQRALSAGIGAADLFREKGVTAMLGFKAGSEVSLEQTAKALKKIFGKGGKYGEASEELGKTFAGTLSMIGDKFFSFKKTIIEAGFFEQLKRQFGDLDKFLENNAGEINLIAKSIGENLAKGMTAVVNIGKDLIPTIQKLGSGLKSIYDGFMALPEFAREVGIVGAFLLGKKGAIGLAALSFVIDKTIDLLNNEKVSMGLIDVQNIEQAHMLLKILNKELQSNTEVILETKTLQNGVNAVYETTVQLTEEERDIKLQEVEALKKYIAIQKQSSILRFTEIQQLRNMFGIQTDITTAKQEEVDISRFLEKQQLRNNLGLTIQKPLQDQILEKLKEQNKQYSLSTEVFNLLNSSVASFSRSFAEAVVLGKSLNMSFKEFAQNIMVDVLAKMIERFALLSIEKILLGDQVLIEDKKLTALKKQNKELQREIMLRMVLALFGGGGGGSSFTQPNIHKQHGGAVAKGQSYMVGERGAELFTPNETGQISQTARGNNRGSTTVNFNINTVDASGFNDLLIRSRGTITQLINNAVNERGSRNII